MVNSQHTTCPATPFASSAATVSMKKRRMSRSWFVTAVAASSMVSSLVSAFQTNLPTTRPHREPKLPSYPVLRRNPSCTQHGVATDPDLLLMEYSRTRRNAIEDMYVLTSPSFDGLASGLIEERGSITTKKPLTKKRITAVTNEKAKKSQKLNKKVVSAIVTTETLPKTTQQATTRAVAPASQKKGRKSRSSTMPGFTGRISDKEIAFRDGIKLVERRTGKKLTETPAARKSRRKRNGEAMYKNSASVPDSLVQFAGEIHDIERITPKQEIELGEKAQEGIRLRNLHAELQLQLEREPTDEEYAAAAGKINVEALRQALEEGLAAKNTLVTSNLRMVQGVVNLYIRNGLGGQYNAGDLMQEGIMALIRAAEKYDPSRGFRFSTYAMYWIRSAVKRSQVYQSRAIVVPQRQHENHKRILRTKQQLTTSLGRKPTNKEIGKVVGLSELQIERCVNGMAQRCFSLDQQIVNKKKPGNDSPENSMYDIISSQSDDNEYNEKVKFFRDELIECLRRYLPEENVELLLLRYGLGDGVIASRGKAGPMTIAEVSESVGLKPDKVRRMINKSLKQLRALLGDEWRQYEQEFM